MSETPKMTPEREKQLRAAVLDECQQIGWGRELFAEIDRLRAELKELRAVNDRHVDRLNSLLRERDAAIQERDRLRAALTRILHWENTTKWLEPIPEDMAEQAREALGTANETHAAQSGATESTKE